MSYKSSKITQTLNLTKETHINHGDTMINDAPALIKSGVMEKIRELSDLSGCKHCGHGFYNQFVPLAPQESCAPDTSKVTCIWHHKCHLLLAHQKSHAPGTVKNVCTYAHHMSQVHHADLQAILHGV